jgi:hypothetical protein
MGGGEDGAKLQFSLWHKLCAHEAQSKPKVTYRFLGASELSIKAK